MSDDERKYLINTSSCDLDMAANPRTPLLGDQPLSYINREQDHHQPNGVNSAASQFTAFADELGDSVANASSRGSLEVANKDNSSGRRGSPVITISREQLDELRSALENATDLLREVNMNSVELDTRSRQSRHYKIPKCITNNLLLLTVVWQVLNIAAVSIAEAFESQSRGKEEKEDKNIFLLSVIIIAFFQTLNLILVSFTTVKLTKQIMHQTVTKSFLAQSFFSTTLLYAGLYTLAYKFNHNSFDLHHPSPTQSALSTPLVFSKMIYFSISTATLCGIAAIVPGLWPAQLIASIQMIMSYLYFASVLYLAVHPYKGDIKWRIISRSSNSTRDYGSRSQTVV
ncbi:uncharacterized protein LOC141883593 isoform X2 [Acropora palmata]|uniref:uncharacterized protein LOC141883593 isoform X2 n=1 Tax=Acropora palmata TaxID=6131 RepID=UPI003DA0631B